MKLKTGRITCKQIELACSYFDRCCFGKSEKQKDEQKSFRICAGWTCEDHFQMKNDTISEEVGHVIEALVGCCIFTWSISFISHR